MGKKSKKSSKALDLQVPDANEGTEEQDVTKINNSEMIENNNTADGMKTKKKKRKHGCADAVNDTSVPPASIDERIQGVKDGIVESAFLEKKKKKKKLQSTHEEELPIEKTIVENMNSDIMDESNITRKKKKKNKDNAVVEVDSKTEIDEMNERTVENLTIISKKKEKNKKILDSDSVATEFLNQNVSVKENQKVSKSQKKKKTGAPVLNKEESQVTEEDIDRFCDELDEEDNKQYEDWVKLIEANLPRPREKN